MRTGVTLPDVTRAADQLLADGERPTVEGVRKVLGTGSPATVNNLLKEYYAALPNRLNLPAAIASAAAALYQQICDTALDEVRVQGEEKQAAFEADVAKLAADRRHFEDDRVRLQQQVASLEGDKQSGLALQAQQSTRITSLERALAEQTERAASAESRATAATEERERATQRHAQELQLLRSQAEGNERHLLGRIDDQQSQLKRLTADRDKEAAAHLQRVAGLETSLSEANKQAAALRNELSIAHRDFINERAHRQDGDRVHSEEIDRLSKEAQAIASEKDRLKSEAAQSAATLKRSVQERDDALREAARLEGKLQAHAARIEELREELAQLRRPGIVGLKPVDLLDE